MPATSQKRRANFSSSSTKSKRAKRAATHQDDERWYLNLGVPTTLGGKGIDAKKCPPGLDLHNHVQRQVNKFDKNLAVDYAVHFKGNYDAWTAPAMRSYSKFELPEQTRIAVNEIVYVRHEDSNPWEADNVDSEEQPDTDDESASEARASGKHLGQVNGSKVGAGSHRKQALTKKSPSGRNSKDWVAQILECRAASSAAVYLRVFWLYRPDDLPGGVLPHHGRDEVVPSNHMEIIEAATVQGTVEGLEKWDEYNDESEINSYEGLIWRQTFNYLTNEMTPLRKYCICQQAAKPEETLIECTNPLCGIWMHRGCIEDAARREFAKRTLAGTLESSGGRSAHHDTPDRMSTPVIEVRPRSEIISVKTEEEREGVGEDGGGGGGDEEEVEEEEVGKEPAASMMNKIGHKMGRWFASHVNSPKATPSVDGIDNNHSEDDNNNNNNNNNDDGGGGETGATAAAKASSRQPRAAAAAAAANALADKLEAHVSAKSENEKEKKRKKPGRKPGSSTPASSQKKGRRRKAPTGAGAAAAAADEEDSPELEAAMKEWTAIVTKRDGNYLVHLTRTVKGDEVEQRWEQIRCLQCKKELS